MATDPSAMLALPRRVQQLPRGVLSAREAEAVLAQPDITRPTGLRDRAILETLYSTGIRRAELCALRRGDIDAERQVLWVRQGKGGRQRVVPIGERALAWIDRYAGTAVRFIQAILGHAQLSTTALYTHVAIGTLQAVHHRTHPVERWASAAA